MKKIISEDKAEYNKMYNLIFKTIIFFPYASLYIKLFCSTKPHSILTND